MLDVAHFLAHPLTFMAVVFYLIDSFFTSPTCGTHPCGPLP